jgi:hypothetical protein
VSEDIPEIFVRNCGTRGVQKTSLRFLHEIAKMSSLANHTSWSPAGTREHRQNPSCSLLRAEFLRLTGLQYAVEGLALAHAKPLLAAGRRGEG